MSALTPLLTPIIALIIHAAMNRLAPVRSQQKLAMWAGLVAALFATGGVSHSLGEGMVNGLSSLAMGYCYFHLFNITETGIRARMLLDINRTGRIVESQYDDRVRVENRLRRLEAFGAIVQPEEGYKPRPGILAVLAVFFANGHVHRIFDYQPKG